MKISVYEADIEGLTSKAWIKLLEIETAFLAEQEELAIAEAEAELAEMEENAEI